MRHRARRDREVMKAAVRDINIEESESEVLVGQEVLNRAIEILARWALRRDQDVAEDAGASVMNRVTADRIKGYGAQDGSN